MRSRVLTNTAWILAASGFNKLSSIILIPVLSRYLGAADFGSFSFALFYVALFSPFSEMGLSPVLIRRSKLEPERSGAIQRKGALIGLASTFGAILLAWGGTVLMGYPPGLRGLIFIASAGLFVSFRDTTFRWFLEVPFRAGLKMRSPALLGIASEAGALTLVLAAVHYGCGVGWVMAAYVLSNLPGFAALAFIFFRTAGSETWRARVETASTLMEALPIGLSNILYTAYLMFGSIALFSFAGAKALGYYALAFRITTSLRIIPESLMHSAYPLLVSAFADRTNNAQRLFSRLAVCLSIIAFPLAFAAGGFSKEAALLLGGKMFVQAAAAIAILIWATAFAFFNTAARFALNAAALQMHNLRVSALMLLCSMALSFALIPGMGVNGAALALAVTEAAGVGINSIALGRAGLTMPAWHIGKAFAAALFAAVCFWQIHGLALKAAVGITAYAAAIYIMFRITPLEALKALRLRESGSLSGYKERGGKGVEKNPGA